jgi:adenylosuccinate synthase
MLPLKVATLLAHHNPLRQGLGKPAVDGAQLTKDLLALAPQILPFAEDVWERLDALRASGKRILFEVRRPPCSTSTTAPIRSSPRPTPWRRRR